MTTALVSTRGQASQPSSATSLLVRPAAGPAASAVAVTGGGCVPGAAVTISFRGRVLGGVRAGQPGEFSATVVIPTDATLGAGQLTAVGPGCRRSASFTVQVTPAGSVPAPATAQGVYGLIEVVGGLSIFAMVLVLAVRRSRRNRSREATRRRHRRRRGIVPFAGPPSTALP